jgi:hypothetical protein
MHSFGEMGQTGVHCHPAAVSRRPVSFLPTATDFARPIFALCPCVGRNSNGVVPLCPAAIRTTEVLAARFHFAFPVPVVDRVGGDFVELHAGLDSAIFGLRATACDTENAATVYAIAPECGRGLSANLGGNAAADERRSTQRFEMSRISPKVSSESIGKCVSAFICG